MFPDLCLLLSLFVCGLITTTYASQWVDIDEYDESMYLSSAAGTFRVQPDWSPIYPRYLSLLFWFLKDPTDVHFLNVRILSIALPVLVYAVSRRLHASCFTAYIAGFCVLVSQGNMPLVPKGNHFSAVAFLAVLLALDLGNLGRRAFFGVLFILSVFFAYIRPEQQFSVVAFFLLFAWLSVQEGSTLRRFAPYALIAGACLCGLAYSFSGLPWGGRAAGAFSQSFVMSYRSLHSRQDPLWDLSDNDLFRNVFGPANSLPQAVHNNVGAVIAHWLWAGRAFPKAFSGLFTKHYPLFDISPRSDWVDSFLFILLYAALLLGALFHFFRFGRPGFPWARERWRTLVIALAVFSVPSLLIGLVYAPWERYILMVWISCMILLASLFPANRAASSRRVIFFSLLLALDGMAVVPRNLPAVSVYGFRDVPRPPFLGIRDQFLAVLAKENRVEPPTCLVSPSNYGAHLRCLLDRGVDDHQDIWENPSLLRRYVLSAGPKYILVTKGRNLPEPQERMHQGTEKVLTGLGRYQHQVLGGGPVIGDLWVRK